MRLLAKILRKTGKTFIRLSKLFDNSNKQNSSLVIEKEDTRDLYKTIYDDYFWLDKNSYIDQCIIKDGLFEEDLTHVVNKIIKRGDTVIDVGANIGYYSVIFSKLVGEGGNVISFEPTNHYMNVLKMNLEANNVSNVKIIKAGLSDKNQNLEIHIEGSTATFHNPKNITPATKEIVQLTTLDEFIENHPLKKIDFIKVDIDGHEPIFLKGAWKTLEKYNPIIILEVSHLHYLQAGFNVWDFYDMLKKKNYKIYYEKNLSEIITKEDFLIKCGNFSYSANIIISKKDIKI